jgi:hypothetical protein
MTVFPIICFLLIAVGAAFPMNAMRKRQHMSWWDYICPFTGVVVWFPLSMLDVGSAVSLSNFVVEVFCIVLVSAALPWIRWVSSHFEKDGFKKVSFILTFLPIIVAVIIRLTMPTLPE